MGHIPFKINMLADPTPAFEGKYYAWDKFYLVKRFQNKYEDDDFA